MAGLEFLLPPLVLLIVLAVACGMAGVVLMARAQTMLPDALSHAILPGVVVAAYLRGNQMGSLSIVIGAIGASVVALAMIQMLERSFGATRAAALATTYPTMLSAGMVLTVLTGLDRTGFDAHAVLFGALDFVLWPDAMGLFTFDAAAWAKAIESAPAGLGFSLVALVIALVGLPLASRPITHQLFDADHFRSQGAAGAWAVEALILTTVVMAAVAAFLTVGAILTVALFAAPALAARADASSLTGWLFGAALTALVYALASFGAIVLLPELILPAMGLLDQPVVLGISLAGSYAVLACSAALVRVMRA